MIEFHSFWKIAQADWLTNNTDMELGIRIQNAHLNIDRTAGIEDLLDAISTEYHRRVAVDRASSRCNLIVILLDETRPTTI